MFSDPLKGPIAARRMDNSIPATHFPKLITARLGIFQRENKMKIKRCLVCLRGALRQGNTDTSAEHEYSDVSKKTTTGKFLVKIFERKFNTFIKQLYN